MTISKLEALYHGLSEQLDEMRTLQKVVHQLSDGLIIVNSKGVISHFNLAAQELLHLKDVAGHSYSKVFDDSFFGFSMQKALVESDKKQRIFLSLNDGRELEVSAASTDEGVALLLHDRTEVVNLERSAQQAHQLSQIGEMAARLAHEIRNPLGGIEGFASMLRGELKDPQHQDMARSIVNGTRTLNALVTNVLEYAKPLTLHFSPIDLVETVREAVCLTKEEVLFHTEVAMWPFSGDKERLKLAFLNLIHNGWEASKKPVEVTVKLGEIAITDHGGGISSELMQKIFTPFFTTKSFGTGLGLPEAKKVFEAHGGEIVVETEVGRGTTMRVKL